MKENIATVAVLVLILTVAIILGAIAGRFDSEGVRERISSFFEGVVGLILIGSIGFIVIAIIVGIFATLTSSPNPDSQKSDGVLESAVEKASKGIPLNAVERQRLNSLGNSEDDERAKEIEQRNGEH